MKEQYCWRALDIRTVYLCGHGSINSINTSSNILKMPFKNKGVELLNLPRTFKHTLPIFLFLGIQSFVK